MKNPLLIGESSVSYSYDFNSHHLVANRPEVVPQIDVWSLWKERNAVSRKARQGNSRKGRGPSEIANA